jgi:tyrosine-protein kinase Etk/Wzc
MVERLQEARIMEESELGYASVVWEALPPIESARPRRGRNLLLGIFAGLALGFGISFLRFSLDKRIYAPDDLKKLNKNVLTVIPDFGPLLREEFDDEEWTKIGDTRISTSLISLTKPFTPISESFRQLRTNIQFARPDKVVQVVAGISATAGEGKTTNATNLAIVMAQADRKTLLIDCDLRRPRLHRVFGQNREPGLIDLLFEDERPVDPAAIDWKLKTAQFHEPVDNLHVLTSGRKIPNPSEFFGSKLFRDFIHQMREHYDMIVLDCAPVLVATDTAIIATQCDAVYVIVKSGEIDPSLLEQAETQLKQTGVEPMGYVLNGFDATQAGGYSYRYRYRYYSYGYKYRYGKYNRYYGYGYGYGYYGDKDKSANEKEAKA